MMVKKFRYVLSAIACVVLIGLAAGCSERENPVTTRTESSQVPFQTPVTFGALAGNPLGDGASRILSVAYASHDSLSVPQAPLPVLYLLHDFGGNGDYFDRYRLQAMLDEMYQAGEIKRMLVVTVGANNNFGGSFYRNSPSSGNYADLVGEIIRYVERNYNVYEAGGKNSRGISGHGMGGYGAMRYAFEHPEMFGSASAMSAPLGFGGAEGDAWLSDYASAIFSENNVTTGDSATYAEISPAVGRTTTNLMFAMAAAFSPHDLGPFTGIDTCYQCQSLRGCPPARLTPCYPCSVFAEVAPEANTFKFPPGTGGRDGCIEPRAPAMIGVKLPFDWSGSKTESVWDSWKASDVQTMLTSDPGIVSDMSLYFDCGIDDELGFLKLNQSFNSALQASGLVRGTDYFYEEYAGYSGAPAGHSDLVAERLRKVLKFHSDRFDRPLSLTNP